MALIDDDEQGLTAEHRQQRADDTTRAFSARGVGKMYHKRSLLELPRGKEMKAWLETSGLEELRRGRALTVVGSSLKARDAVILMARGCMLKGLDAYVITMPKLVSMMKHNSGDEWARIRNAEVLAFVGMLHFTGRKECPLTPWQTADIEEFLIERLAEARAIIPQIDVPFSQAPDWYSPALAEAFSENNTEVVL